MVHLCFKTSIIAGCMFRLDCPFKMFNTRTYDYTKPVYIFVLLIILCLPFRLTLINDISNTQVSSPEKHTNLLLIKNITDQK